MMSFSAHQRAGVFCRRCTCPDDLRSFRQLSSFNWEFQKIIDRFFDLKNCYKSFIDLKIRKIIASFYCFEKFRKSLPVFFDLKKCYHFP
jgi:hypothetical protein